MAVHGRAIGDDHDAIGRSHRLGSSGTERTVPVLREDGDVWIVVADSRALTLEQPDDVEGRALPDVVDVTLVGDAQH